jgi:hypothetical protein
METVNRKEVNATCKMQQQSAEILDSRISDLPHYWNTCLQWNRKGSTHHSISDIFQILNYR